MTSITLSSTSAVIVAESVRLGWAAVLKERAEGKIDYQTYFTDMGVNKQNLPEHVKIFREAFKSAHRRATGSEIKAYATKVRNGLGYYLPSEETVSAVTLRVSLSGEGGGSTVVATDHPLYEQIVALVTGQTAAV